MVTLRVQRRPVAEFDDVASGQGLDVLPLDLKARNGRVERVFTTLRELRHALGKSRNVALFQLEFDGGEVLAPAIVLKIETSPSTREATRLHLLRVSMDDRLRLPIPVMVDKIPDSVKRGRAKVIQHLTHLEVSGAVRDLPMHISADMTDAAPGDVLFVRQLNLPVDIESFTDGASAVATIVSNNSHL